MSSFDNFQHLEIFSSESLKELPISFFYYERIGVGNEKEIISKGIYKFHHSTQFNTFKYLIVDFHRPISKLFKIDS